MSVLFGFQLLYFGKCILTKSAGWANPILRNIFPGSSGRDTVVRIAQLRIIHIAAGALPLIHFSILLSFVDLHHCRSVFSPVSTLTRPLSFYLISAKTAIPARTFFHSSLSMKISNHEPFAENIYITCPHACHFPAALCRQPMCNDSSAPLSPVP